MIADKSAQAEYEIFVMSHCTDALQSFTCINWKIYEPLQRDIIALAKSLAIEIFNDPTAPDDGPAKFWQSSDFEQVFSERSRSSDHGLKRYYMHRQQKELLDRIYSTALAIASTAYDTGVERGQDVIGNLAAGRTSIDDFNKYQIERAAKVQRVPDENAPKPNK